ncbi:filamin [Echinococcus multilocularis]|uniref:Filamin n=1 Tax=Echinococcus multilocularis TaxID=6211 RepID=A0A068YFL8_ECHMU|nr:filamin [Echinococcus multilocularis]
MPQAERDLAEDAQWKIFQKNTFTRWANEHLKQAKTSVDDIQTDFSDGIKLIRLVEVLSGKKFAHVNKRPTFRTQKLENVTMVLKFLEEDEGLKLVNIDSTDIVDSRLKLILGLIWTLILHYSISMPMWEGEEELPQDPKGKGPTPKQRILAWANSKMLDRPVKNLTTDWNSGVAIGALVDACAPGLCPDWDTWSPRNPLQNATEAMVAAQEWLDVPLLIRPEEMIDPKVDEKAMMTYLSQFPNAKLKEGAPLRPKINPARVRAYGPGLEETGNTVNSIARFTVDTFAAGRAELEVIILTAGGAAIPCEIVKNEDRNLTYSCSYVPKNEGPYRIIIKYAGKEIPNSPFPVNVEGAPGDPRKVTVSGPGIEANGGNGVGRRTFFNAFTKNAGAGLVSCDVIDPNGRRDTIKPRITHPDEDGPFLIEYTPKMEGPHKVEVMFVGQPIPNSPFPVNVGPPCNPSLAYTTGRGVQEKGIRVNDVAVFQVHTERAGGPVELFVDLKRPDGQVEPVKILKVSEHLYTCSYVPSRPGQYTLAVQYEGEHIRCSPFKIIVGPYKQSKVRAFGPGLSKGIIKIPNLFTVVSNDELGAIGFLIEGPSSAAIKCVDNGDTSAEVSYEVDLPGEYAIHITCDGEDIQGSPFMAMVDAPSNIDVNRIKVLGKGISQTPGDVIKGVSTDFTIDLTHVMPSLTQVAQKKKLTLKDLLFVECNDSLGEIVPIEVFESSIGKFTIKYTPKSIGVITVHMAIDGECLKQSGTRVPVGLDAVVGGIKLSGPGLESAKVKTPTYFIMDLTNISQPANRKNVISETVFHITEEDGVPIIPKVFDNQDGTYRIEYVPPENSTALGISVLVAGSQIAQSPYVVPVSPAFDVSKLKVTGLDSSVFKDCLLKFIVDAREIDPAGEETVSAIIKDPDGRRSASSVVNRHDGTYLVTYSAAMEGPHTIEVTYGGVQIPGSPFVVDVSAGFDASRVRAYGPGLEPSGPHLMPNLKTEFTVDMSGAGKGGLGLSIEGPADAAINCIDNKDGTCTVEYTPTMAGTHDIHLKFGGIEIPMSPFHVRIQGNADVSKVRCYGHGLEPNKVRASVPATFVADTSLAGNAPIEATFTPAPGVAPVAAAVNPVAGQPGLYECTYVPQARGPCQVEVTCEGKPIIGSPFTILVRPTTEPEKVRLAGAGIRGPVQASLPSTFTVDATDAGLGDLKLDVMDPVGHSLPISVISITPEQLEQVNTAPIQKGMPQPSDITSGPDSGLLACTYEPFIVGEHKIHVMYAGIEIPESPFVFESLHVGRADLCEIKGDVKPRIAVGDEASVTVDTSRAGPGNLMCRATQVSGGRSIDLPVEVEANDDGTSTAYLLPKEAGPVQVELRYGGQLIPNGKYTQEAVPAEELEVPTTPIEAHYAPVDFHLVVSGKDDHSLQAVVVRPSGVNDQVETKEDKDGTMTVKYQPKERGMHELHVTTVASGSDLRMPLKGSPFKFFVDNAASGNITAYGPGLSHGVTGQPAEFTVDMKNAGAGGLSVSVEGPSKVEMSCTENGDGACRVTYYPMVPGEYTINLKFMDKPVSGSPYVAKITGEPKKRTQMNMSSMNCVSFEAGIDDISILTATVTSPSGHEEPCVLKKLPNNRMGISFTPKETGEHLVNVYKAGKHIPKSPFKVNVSSEDVGDPTRVRVIWPEGVQPMANQRNEFLVDSKNAGYATLSLSIEGPSKAEIECTDNSDGTCTVAYCPTEPGTYLVNVRYADQHVPGSPFTVHVGGEASQRMVQRIVRSRQAFEATQVGNECALTIRIPGDIREITGEVYSSSGRHIPCDIVPIDDERISIHFVPQERGIHTVSILNRGVHVPGSPFQLTVGQPVEGGPSKVRVSGRGLEYGEVNNPNEFSIYTHEAGAGGLSIAIEGPSKAEISFKDHQDGSCSVYYKVRRPGEYICSIKFADEHIPFSPFRIFVTDPKEGGRSETYEVPIHFTTNDRVSHESETNQLVGPVAFTVHCPDVDHVLEATVESPSKIVERAMVHKLDGDQHVVRFVPRESGAHFVRVYLVPENEAHLGARAPHAKEIDGSPFHIAVGDSMADPSTVYATGDGLAHGSVGVKNKFFVNTANAGRGLLSVVVDGPSKVQITCEERPDGYEFSYIPTLPGDYKINIKYGGNFDIFGSPFTARITGSPMGDIMQQGSIEPTTIVLDTATKTMSSRTYEATSVISKGIAQNVKCSGLGLKRGFVGKENQFFVDASKAGNAMLLAGMMGKVHPCERFEIVHTGNNRFSVTYRVEEVGQYWLSIMWGNQHIPGSPFRVEISPTVPRPLQLLSHTLLHSQASASSSSKKEASVSWLKYFALAKFLLCETDFSAIHNFVNSASLG